MLRVGSGLGIKPLQKVEKVWAGDEPTGHKGYLDLENERNF